MSEEPKRGTEAFRDCFRAPEVIEQRRRERELHRKTGLDPLGVSTPEQIARDLRLVMGSAANAGLEVGTPFFHANGEAVTEGELVAFSVSRGATMHPPPKPVRVPTPTETTVAALEKQVRLVAKLSKRLGIERARRKAYAKRVDELAKDLSTLLDAQAPAGSLASWLARAVLGVKPKGST